MSEGPAPTPDAARVEIPNDPAAIERAQQAVMAALERHAYPKASVFALRLSLHEAITNAFVHGHETLPAATTVALEYDVGPDQVRLVVEDQGPGYRPDAVPDPTLEENLEEPHGRGLALIRAYMTSVMHNERGNRIEMIYKRPVGAAH